VEEALFIFDIYYPFVIPVLTNSMFTQSNITFISKHVLFTFTLLTYVLTYSVIVGLICYNIKIYLTFRGPCIVKYSYNKSQQDALFLNFILVKNSTCFGQIYCPSSGVLILYSQQLVFVIQLC